MNKDNHRDRLILELRRKYKQEQSAVPVRERKGFKERILYGGLCTIMLPAYMQDMEQKDRLAKYRNLLHPDVAVTDGNADATFSFSSVGGAEGQRTRNRGWKSCGRICGKCGSRPSFMIRVL